MKIVLNRCYGGFNVSNKLVELCVERGMTLEVFDEENSRDKDFYLFEDENWEDKYSINHFKDKEIRCNPIFAKAVEELGSKANGKHSKLEVFEIPFDSVEGWYIDEGHGFEYVHENHGRWPDE